MSECSPTSSSTSPSPVHAERAPTLGGAGAIGNRDGSVGLGRDNTGSGSGLTAGTDALRLACLECLEVRRAARGTLTNVCAAREN